MDDCGSGGKPPPGPPPPLPTLADPAPPDIHYRLLVAQYVAIACLAVSLPFAYSQIYDSFLILTSWPCSYACGTGFSRSLTSLKWSVVSKYALVIFCTVYMLSLGELSLPIVWSVTLLMLYCRKRLCDHLSRCHHSAKWCLFWAFSCYPEVVLTYITMQIWATKIHASGLQES